MVKDLTNCKFGKLTVLEFSYCKNRKAYWKCKCDCGNIITIAGNSLSSGNTKSCGCIKPTGRGTRNLLSQTFGKLKVIGTTKPINRRTAWKCKCECGNVIDVQAKLS